MSALAYLPSNRSMHSAGGIIAPQPNRYGERHGIEIAMIDGFRLYTQSITLLFLKR
jgi:hypothetical protein